MSRLFFLGALGLSLLRSAEAQDCPPATAGVRIPGCWGEPGCAYVIASDLGPGAACPFDYCNCGGTVGPLLPMTLSGTPTVGCNAYTTVPSASSCPTAPASVPAPSAPATTSASPSGGGSGGGLPYGPAGPADGPGGAFGAPGGPVLPTPVTTGGPISTASNAFDTAAPSVTTFSYSGGVLIYTKQTFSDQTTVTAPTTVTTTITNTAPGGSVSTYTGPIIVGSGGVWWGPPGTAPDCIWPFCTSSGLGGASGGGGGSEGGTPAGGSPGGSGGGTPGDSGGSPGGSSGGSSGGSGGGSSGGSGGGSSGGSGGGSSGGSGGGSGGGSSGGSGGGSGGGSSGGSGGGSGGGSSGGSGGGSSGGSGGGSGGGSSGGSSGGNGGDGGQGSNGQPAPEACPGAGPKVKRSLFHYITNGRLAKRAEEDPISINPLKDAFNTFGQDKNKNGLASSALDSAEGILTNKFPKGRENAYVTGLEGHFKLPNKVTIGTGDNQQTFQANENLFWRVRWDFDPTKGPHVNAQFGTKPSSKFAFKLDPSKFTNGNPKDSMAQVALDMNKLVQYSKADNDGKSEPNFDKAGGKDKAIENLKTAWKAIAEGPC